MHSRIISVCRCDSQKNLLIAANRPSIISMGSSSSYGASAVSNSDVTEFAPIKRGSRYVCPWREFKRPGLCAVLHWFMFIKDETNIPPRQELDDILPVKRVQQCDLEKSPDDKIKITWIGHATVLVQFDGITILTDPLFRDFSGPEIARCLSCFGYWRYRPAACGVEDLTALDAVVISHNHHDHLDVGSVKDINQKFPDVKWYVPEGSQNWFRSIGCLNVCEMTWWQEETLTVCGREFAFISTPSQHWCQRGIFDLNKCLWCSWIVKGPSGKSFFFGGDTGYYESLFKKIGQEYGPFDLAAIPIGAYHPRSITWYQHVDPEEAVKIHQDIRSKISVGIHWGTFALTNEFYLEPPRAVEKKMIEKELDPNTFISICPGETWVVGDHREHPPFMKQERVPGESTDKRKNEF